MFIFLTLLSICFIYFLFYKHFSAYIPILMYHRIADVPGDRNALPPDKFQEQLDYMYKNGYSTITMQMLYDYYTKNTPLPPKPVLLTFDDGYEDNYQIALPLLKERNMSAVVFPITNWIGKENKWENFNKALTRTMTLEQLKEWHAAGMEIASHTVNHPFLTECDKSKLIFELRESKNYLEEVLQIKIQFLCYPYGYFNKNAINIAQSVGYKAAFAIFNDVPLHPIYLFALPRISIPAYQSLWEFKLKISQIHILFILLRKIERFLKLNFSPPIKNKG